MVSVAGACATSTPSERERATTVSGQARASDSDAFGGCSRTCTSCSIVVRGSPRVQEDGGGRDGPPRVGQPVDAHVERVHDLALVADGGQHFGHSSSLPISGVSSDSREGDTFGYIGQAARGFESKRGSHVNPKLLGTRVGQRGGRSQIV